jgi:hypothetical protein
MFDASLPLVRNSRWTEDRMWALVAFWVCELLLVLLEIAASHAILENFKSGNFTECTSHEDIYIYILIKIWLCINATCAGINA